MRGVLLIVESTDASSQVALKASEEVGSTAETLRSEVTDFLTAMSRGDEAERRLYERVSAAGFVTTLRIAGRPGIEVRMEDISRGGMGVAHVFADDAGTEVEAILPGGNPVKGRIARKTAKSTGIIFLQNQESLVLIDQAMAMVMQQAA
jgi:hypothetical protein